MGESREEGRPHPGEVTPGLGRPGAASAGGTGRSSNGDGLRLGWGEGKGMGEELRGRVKWSQGSVGNPFEATGARGGSTQRSTDLGLGNGYGVQLLVFGLVQARNENRK